MRYSREWTMLFKLTSLDFWAIAPKRVVFLALTWGMWGMNFQKNRSSGSEVSAKKVLTSPKSSYLLANHNKTCTVCSTYVESGMCGFSRESFQRKLRYPYNIMTCNRKTNCCNLQGANLSCHIHTAFYSCFWRTVILCRMLSRRQVYQCTFDLR